jgi:hypothetical protein
MKSTSPMMVVFGSLAMNQAAFFARVGAALCDSGYRIAHLCFHERSHEWLERNGYRSYNAYAWQPVNPDTVDLSVYGIDDPAALLRHEQAAYELDDMRALMRKLQGHTYASARILDDVAGGALPDTVVLVQELGGFLSVLGAHYAARARGCDSFFIEPSFFRGRVFISRNRLAAPEVLSPQATRAGHEVAQYLARTLEQQRVVIPAKDTHHYRKAGAKLADRRNLRRLIEKTWDKYVLGKREEFEHIGGHVSRHVRMFLNARRLRGSYRALEGLGRFVYYPLHVPADFALTIRAPDYLDQCALLAALCRSVPSTHRVVFKEHPALIGAIPYSRLAALLHEHGNLAMLDPRINNYDVLKQADAVVTVNSKSGAEALLLGKPVLVLGDSFYRASRHVVRVDSLSDLRAALCDAIERPRALDSTQVAPYFQDVWDSSYAGELYELSESNVTAFAESLGTALARAPAPLG